MDTRTKIPAVVSARPPACRSRLRLYAFLTSFGTALVACSLAGHLMTSQNIFLNFDRFHQRLTPDSNFFPTARQVRELALATLDKSKVNVVIGGDLVFYCVGQPRGFTIADNLRRELGDNYRVINLAMRGGDISGMAELTVEMLVRDHYRFIYLSDVPSPSPQLIGKPPYQYFFWDAKARGYIIDWRVRDAALNLHAWLCDEAIGGWLNNYLNFNELWSTIGYEFKFTIFSDFDSGYVLASA